MRRLPALLICLAIAGCATAGSSEPGEVPEPVLAAGPAGEQGVVPVAVEVDVTSDVGTLLTRSVVGPPLAEPVPVAPAIELPRGGRQVFPGHLVVMHYGTAGTGVLGVLGEGTPEQAVARLTRAAAPYARAAGRTVLPAFELITTVASRGPGADGTYSSGLSHAQVQRYLDAARRAKMLLVLDFQPGRADLLAQVRRYERFLLQPEVGIALDPEWKLTGTQRPGRQIGRVSAAEVNRVSAYLASLRRLHRLPEKLFVVHQFRHSMLPDRERIVARNGLATVLHVDGFGTQGEKRRTYGALQDPSRFHMGFKLFYDEDTDLMTPAEAMALRPRPELISYQ